MISYRQADLRSKIRQMEPIIVGDKVTMSPEGKLYLESDPKIVSQDRRIGIVTYSHNNDIFIRWPNAHHDEQWSRKYIEKVRGKPIKTKADLRDRLRQQKEANDMMTTILVVFTYDAGEDGDYRWQLGDVDVTDPGSISINAAEIKADQVKSTVGMIMNLMQPAAGWGNLVVEQAVSLMDALVLNLRRQPGIKVVSDYDTEIDADQAELGNTYIAYMFSVGV